MLREPSPGRRERRTMTRDTASDARGSHRRRSASETASIAATRGTSTGRAASLRPDHYRQFNHITQSTPPTGHGSDSTHDTYTDSGTKAQCISLNTFFASELNTNQEFCIPSSSLEVNMLRLCATFWILVTISSTYVSCDWLSVWLQWTFLWSNKLTLKTFDITYKSFKRQGFSVLDNTSLV